MMIEEQPWSDSLSETEGILILDALALAIDAAEWTGGGKGDAFMDLYQKIAPYILIEEPNDHDEIHYFRLHEDDI